MVWLALCGQLILFVGSGQNWWEEALGVFFFCVVGKILVLVFEKSLYGISKYHLWGLYAMVTVGAILIAGLDSWLSKESRCVQHFRSTDFDLLSPSVRKMNRERPYSICKLSRKSFVINAILGLALTAGLNIVIGYMYITRMISTARAVHKNEELDIVQIHRNSADREVSRETMQMLVYVRKCGIIALTSIISNLLAIVIVGVKGVAVVMFVDRVFNGIMMLSSFAFAERIYQFFFGCCSQKTEDLLSRIKYYLNCVAHTTVKKNFGNQINFICEETVFLNFFVNNICKSWEIKNI
ncbi:hypothetical protein RFI_29358 [Reticulomyxa filosa]|uniref:Uncharacterized protein n=1 Tax=Reticulomyxa filosa TaxID=46433 RepID=X6M3I7_RETFI|nr:hypothetical protein RFI_29358 [Reticulomyxa filosa]|eukprot:ETO08032.1 hypothetical protein RFI_29358 [Reticulomyxa filosa]